MLLLLGIAEHYDVRWQLSNSVELGLRAASIAGVERVWPSAVRRSEQPGQGPPRVTVPADWASQATDLARSIGSYTILARVVDAEGRILAVHGGPREALPDLDPESVRRYVTQVPRDDRRGEGSFAWSSPDRWQTLYYPLRDDGGRVVGVIVTATPWRAYASVLSALGRDILLVGLVLLALAVVLSRQAGAILAAPLARLAQTARRIGTGDLQARTGMVEGRNEVYVVARELDRMAERVQDTVTAQQRFVEDASHELRTPLTILGGTADMLALDPSEEVRRRGLDTIAREVGKMQRLVDDLLLLARSENAPIMKSTVEVAEVLDEVREYADVLKGGRTLAVRCEEGLRLSADRGQLERALRNLIENAVRYTADDGRIEVEARRSDGALRLEVADNGVGISAADLPHVFDRFYRADASRARRSGGTGLGLAIVRSIVELHGGRYGVESPTSPAGGPAGTRIWLELPL
jgi:signal transduction histidine kinase